MYRPAVSFFVGSSSRSGIELAKRAAGRAAVAHSFKPSAQRTVGIGSGSTVVAVVEALADLRSSLGEHRCDKSFAELSLTLILKTRFVPTGFQSAQLIKAAGLRMAQIGELLCNCPFGRN